MTSPGTDLDGTPTPAARAAESGAAAAHGNGDAPTAVHAPGEALAPPADPVAACARCGASLQPGQEWCLSCGAPVATRVVAARGWQLPIAIVAAILGLAVAGLLIAFLAVAGDDGSGTIAQTPAPTATPAPPAAVPPAPTPAPSASPTATPTPTPTPTPAATPTPTPAAGTVGTWPAGKDAWTVVLFSPTSRTEADKKAKELSTGGTPVGVLDSDDFSSLRGGYFVVFSGQYPTSKAAEAALAGLKAKTSGAYVRRVTPR